MIMMQGKWHIFNVYIQNMLFLVYPCYYHNAVTLYEFLYVQLINIMEILLSYRLLLETVTYLVLLCVVDRKTFQCFFLSFSLKKPNGKS